MALIQSRCGDNFLTFDTEKHIYYLNGEAVPGATDVKNGLPTPFNLTQWKIGEGARYVLEALTELSDTKRYPKLEQFPLLKTHAETIIKEAKNATKRILDATADIGTFMHDYCHARRLGKPFDDAAVRGHRDEPAIRKRFLEVDRWVEERSRKETVIAAEDVVGSVQFRFAGKFDVLVQRKDSGVLRLQDYKSSKGFYSEHFIQQGGYRQAIQEWLGLKVDELETIRFNDNTEKPASLVIADSEQVQDFTNAFLIARQMRLFQRKYDPFFEKLFRDARPKSKKQKKD